MLLRLFAEGDFQQAFVPMLADVKEKSSPENCQHFIHNVFTLLALAVLAASVLGILIAPLLVWAIAAGLSSDPDAFDLAVLLTRFMFPYIAFMALVALAASILNTWKHFAIPAVTPVLLNLSFIVFTVLLAPQLDQPIWALAFAVLAGGVLQLGTQVVALARLGIRLRLSPVRFETDDPRPLWGGGRPAVHFDQYQHCLTFGTRSGHLAQLRGPFDGISHGPLRGSTWDSPLAWTLESFLTRGPALLQPTFRPCLTARGTCWTAGRHWTLAHIRRSGSLSVSGKKLLP